MKTPTELLTIKEFCDKHDACADGRKWALANCETMQDAWDKCSDEYLLWIATRAGVLTDKELRLFAVFCARQNLHLLTDQRSIDAIDIAEKYANGEATKKELAAAWSAARDAAWAAAWDAASAEAWSAAIDAAWDTASAAASDEAWSAAIDAAWAAACAAAWDEAWDAQSEYLRSNTKPNFAK
jgi:hypothetical protein